MGNRVEISGVRLSRQATILAQKARQAGINPDSVFKRAVQDALSEGRNKVGVFGKAGEQLVYLRETVQRAQFDRSRRR